MQWSHPKMQGDLPQPCRAHSATLVGRGIAIVGGGEGETYYNALHVFDIHTHAVLVAPDIRDRGHAAAAACAHDGAVPEQDFGCRR